MMYDILIKNGLLITMGTGMPAIEDGAVLIKKDKIKDFGPTNKFENIKARKYINAKDKIIMPGLINCHTHIPMSMFRGFADDLALDVWLNEHIFPAEAKYVNPESVYKWSLHSCKEMLLSGTTTCCDGYFFEKFAAKAMVDSGIRAIAGQGVIDFCAPDVLNPKDNIKTAIDFVEKFSDTSLRVTPSIFCHSAYTCSKSTLIRAKAACDKRNLLFQIHTAETKKETEKIQKPPNMSIIEYFASIGILDKNTLLIHSIWIDDKDIDIIYKYGANVAHCPESNMKLASGIAPITKILEKGINTGLGTDSSASNNDHDLFAEMDTAAKLQKVALLDPCVMDVQTTLNMATIQGAKALGMEKTIGSIDKKKKADIILVNTQKPHLIPMHNSFSNLVYCTKASDVSMVMVDGRVLVENSKLL